MRYVSSEKSWCPGVSRRFNWYLKAACCEEEPDWYGARTDALSTVRLQIYHQCTVCYRWVGLLLVVLEWKYSGSNGNPSEKHLWKKRLSILSYRNYRRHRPRFFNLHPIRCCLSLIGSSLDCTCILNGTTKQKQLFSQCCFSCIVMISNTLMKLLFYMFWIYQHQDVIWSQNCDVYQSHSKVHDSSPLPIDCDRPHLHQNTELMELEIFQSIGKKMRSWQW